MVRAHGESGLTARLEPATIDGLVYASSMVILYAARHQLPVPALARWLLALGILATLAANVAHGWPGGPVGAVVAAWPAASLVGSYELLLWLIRTTATSGMTHERTAGQSGGPADPAASGLRLVPAPGSGSPHPIETASLATIATKPAASAPVPWTAAWASEPEGCRPDRAYQPADRDEALVPAQPAPGTSTPPEPDTDGAAVAACRASLKADDPLSERKLAAMFGKTSRRWARNRMAEARQDLTLAIADNR